MLKRKPGKPWRETQKQSRRKLQLFSISYAPIFTEKMLKIWLIVLVLTSLFKFQEQHLKRGRLKICIKALLENTIVLQNDQTCRLKLFRITIYTPRARTSWPLWFDIFCQDVSVIVRTFEFLSGHFSFWQDVWYMYGFEFFLSNLWKYAN